MTKRLRSTLIVLSLSWWTMALATAGASEPPVPNARTPEPGLTVGGQPTLEQLDALKAEGFVKVIDLRPEGEFHDFEPKTEVESRGMDYVRIPVSNIGAITAEDARALHAAVHDASGPVLLHCRSGWRAGGLYAIEQFLLHDASEAEAMRKASAAHGERLTDEVANWIEENDA